MIRVGSLFQLLRQSSAILKVTTESKPFGDIPLKEKHFSFLFIRNCFIFFKPRKKSSIRVLFVFYLMFREIEEINSVAIPMGFTFSSCSAVKTIEDKVICFKLGNNSLFPFE